MHWHLNSNWRTELELNFRSSDKPKSFCSCLQARRGEARPELIDPHKVNEVRGMGGEWAVGRAVATGAAAAAAAADFVPFFNTFVK